MAKKRAAAKRAAGKATRAFGKKATKKSSGTPRRTAGKTKKAGAQRARGGARRSSLTRAVAGACVDLITAGEIVQDAIPDGPHDIDSTLEDVGLITVGQRTTFRVEVVDGVNERGCTIDAGDVPNAATTTLRETRKAVQQNAR